MRFLSYDHVEVQVPDEVIEQFKAEGGRFGFARFLRTERGLGLKDAKETAWRFFPDEEACVECKGATTVFVPPTRRNPNKPTSDEIDWARNRQMMAAIQSIRRRLGLTLKQAKAAIEDELGAHVTCRVCKGYVPAQRLVDKEVQRDAPLRWVRYRRG